MKKNFLLLIFAVLLSSCSMTVNEFLGIPPTATVVPTFFTNTPVDTPTFTPTFSTPTFTITPTLIGLKAKTSAPYFTPTQLAFTSVSVTPLPSATPILIVQQVPMPGFIRISVSAAEFYKGDKCQPTSVKFTAQVVDSASAAFVLLFVRFKSKQSGSTGHWSDSIAMQSTGVGIFTHDLIPSEMKAVDSFENAWVQYQLVIIDNNSKQTKTDVFSDQLTLLECVPTPIPSLTAATTATPTP